jgi:hypothetical protein
MFAENVAHNLCCQIRADDNSSTCTFTTEKSVTFTGACASEFIPSINCSFVYKAKEGRYVRIYNYNIDNNVAEYMAYIHVQCTCHNYQQKYQVLQSIIANFLSNT